MEKIKLFLISIIAILCIGAFFYKADSVINKKNNNNASNKDNVVFITYDELEKKVNNKEDFVLVVTQEGCSHCKNYAPTVKKVANKYDYKIYDLNLTKLSDDENKKISTIANVSGTPTTIFFKKGVEESTLNRINGETSEEKLATKLKKLGYIGD